MVDKKPKAEYELMKKIEETVTYVRPDGFDEESQMVGNAKDVILWLLKNDSSVKHLSLSKKFKLECRGCDRKIKDAEDYVRYRGNVFCPECADNKNLARFFC